MTESRRSILTWRDYQSWRANGIQWWNIKCFRGDIIWQVRAINSLVFSHLSRRGNLWLCLLPHGRKFQLSTFLLLLFQTVIIMLRTDSFGHGSIKLNLMYLLKFQHEVVAKPPWNHCFLYLWFPYSSSKVFKVSAGVRFGAASSRITLLVVEVEHFPSQAVSGARLIE